MNRISRLLSLLCGVVLALAGCGGGSRNESSAGATAATPGLRAHAPATSAAPAVADQVLDFAEQTFPQYFPSHSATQSSPPFLHRFYPKTGIYVGVVVGSHPGYTLDGVYVLGGAFGPSPLYVGPLTAFVTPKAGPTEVNSGCYDLALFDTQGTHLEVSYDVTGSETGTVAVDPRVGGLTHFEGHQAREIVTTTNGTLRGVTARDVTKTYGRITGNAETTHHGSVSVRTGTLGKVSTTITTRSVASPAFVERQYGLAVGGSVTQVDTGTTTQTTVATGAPETTDTWTNRITSTFRYLGRETLTEPAAIFDTCKFEESLPGTLSTTWVIYGLGIEVKTVDNDGSGSDTSVARSVVLNGRRL